MGESWPQKINRKWGLDISRIAITWTDEIKQ